MRTIEALKSVDSKKSDDIDDELRVMRPNGRGVKSTDLV